MRSTPERILYLDWLKVLIVYGIFVFHVALVFSAGTWLISNHDRSIILSAFAGFCFPWGIPAMFLIAGADAWFGLRAQSPGEFLKGRIQRLLVPFVIAFVVLSPFQRFVSSHNPPPPIDQIGGFYVAFFSSFRFEPTLQWIGTYWMHLWFLGYLFAISVVCLPLLTSLRADTGRRFTTMLVKISNRRGGLYLLALPLVASQVVLRPLFPDYQDWADVATYTVAFMFGAILFSNRGFETAIRRDIRWILVVGTVALLGVGLILWLSPSHMPSAKGASLGAELVFSMLWSLDIWSWLIAVLYLGIRWLEVPNRVLTYLQESVLPFYVLHHPAVLVVASFVVTWNLGVWPKFAVILFVAFALTMGLYEFGVRRWRLTRLLFGLKPLPTVTGVSRPSPAM